MTPSPAARELAERVVEKYFQECTIYGNVDEELEGIAAAEIDRGVAELVDTAIEARRQLAVEHSGGILGCTGCRAYEDLKNVLAKWRVPSAGKGVEK